MAFRPSMFDPRVRSAVAERIGALTPDAPRRWGKMTAPEMIAHLTDQMRHTLELSPVAARPGPMRWPPVRWALIYLIPWPRGRAQGPPEAFLTRPRSWPEDIAELQSLLERFAARGERSDWPDHALFGRMTGKDWGVFVYKHFDHHLRQFGV